MLVGHLAIQDRLSGGLIAAVFVSQQRYQGLLEGGEAAFELAFGLRTGSDQVGHAQGGKGALELQTRIPVIGHGSVAKKAEAIRGHDQRPVVLEQAAAKRLEMIPSRSGRDKDRAQKFSGMIIAGQEQGLLVRGRPPLVDGRIVLPQFVEASPFPAAAGFWARFGLRDEVGKMRADKGGDRLPLALETEADRQFLGHPLKVGRLLQWDKIFEELAGLRRPFWPVTATGELGAERGAV